MLSKAYKRGFMDKFAEFGKSADMAAVNKAFEKYNLEDAKARGMAEREPYVRPETFGQSVDQTKNRALAHIKSLGRGLASAGAVAGIRAANGLFDYATWLPSLADQLVFGSLMGVDEGRGMFGRMRGNLNRRIDAKVHKIRKWSDDYDYRHRIGGKFNRFLNGAVADGIGEAAGFGGLVGLASKGAARVLPLGFGAYGALQSLYFGGPKELRDREAWIRSLKPFDRIGIDPTSTPTNQQMAPTLDEYRRYHMPAAAWQTSPSGYINIPYNWRHTPMGGLVQFREFGT